MIEAALGRLGAMKGDLLAPGVFEALVGATDVAAARQLLDSTAYSPAQRRTEADASPAALERALWDEVLAGWSKLVKFIEGAPRECARLMAGSFEVDTIRRTVRRILASLGPEEAPPLWRTGAVLASFDAEELGRAPSLERMREMLARTPHGRAFERASRRLEMGADLFAFEQALEIGYREAFIASAGAIWGAIGRSARAYVARRELYTSVRWALRLRFVRGLDAEEAIQYVPAPAPGSERKLFQEVLTSPGIEDAAARIGPLLGERAGRRSIQGRSIRGPHELDRALRRAFARWARRELKRRFLEFASVLAYFDVRSQEVRDVIAILTARRQGRTAREIRDYIGLAA